MAGNPKYITSTSRNLRAEGIGAQKGYKKKSTKLKEAIGLSGWQRLQDYLLNEGADKLVDSLQQLSPKDFVIAYNALGDFVKPRISRTTVLGDKNEPLTLRVAYKPEKGLENAQEGHDYIDYEEKPDA